MKDTIYREDAIEAIQTAYCKPCKERGDDHNEVVCRACNFDDAMCQIDALQSAEAEPSLKAIKRQIDEHWYLDPPSAEATCETCADRAMCIMSAPDGKWKACKDYRPSAEAVQGWIPCSERLPEKGELVLVTVWNDVTIAWRNIYGGWDSAEYMYEKGDVIAWMPLPKPYREDDELNV